MKNNKKRRPCTALAMTAALMIGLLFTGCGQKNIADTGSSTEQTSIDEYQISTDGAKPAGKKSEVVTVKADSSGSVKSISDEITLSELSDGINVMETTDLSDLKNTVGDEDFVILTDGTVIFENKGSDITYKGNASADIPVSVKVTYYLDGVETSPKKMAGASGEIKIRFDYENKTKETIDVNGETITTPIPFLAVSATTLDKKIFSDIKVTNGKVVNLSGRQMAIGYALPGLSDTLSLNSYEMFENSKEIPEYVEITAHAENFSLEFTETIITNSVFSSLDDDAFDDEDNLSDSVNKLSDASADVLDGISELNSGLTEFSGHLTSYTDGVSAVSTGITNLQAGIKAINDNKAALKAGADSLASGLAALDSNLKASSGLDTQALTDAMSNLINDLYVINTQATALDASASSVEQYVTAAENWQQNVLTLVRAADASLASIDTTEMSSDAASDIQSARSSLASVLALSVPSAPQINVDADALSSAVNSLQSHMAVISAAGESLAGFEDTMSSLQSAVSQLSAGSTKLAEGIGTFNSGIDQLSSGASQIASGSSELSKAGNELVKAMKEVVSGTGELEDGYKELDEEGIQDITSLLNKFKALQKADACYDNYSGKADGQKSSVVFMIETEQIK